MGKVIAEWLSYSLQICSKIQDLNPALPQIGGSWGSAPDPPRRTNNLENIFPVG